jgi:hypothetical protein
VRALARDALAVGVKGTLPTNQQYLEQLGLGAATIQRALEELRHRRALRTRSRGHLGRVVMAVDLAAAWRTGGLPPLRLALPPAGPVETEALHDVLAEALAAVGIAHHSHTVRGGLRRLDLVSQGEADLTVVPNGVLTARPPSGLLVRRLGVGTYYGRDRVQVVTRRDDAAPPRRIADDRDVVSHHRMTLGEFPGEGGYLYVQIPVPRIPAAVLQGEADAGLWHLSPSVVPLARAGLLLRPLQTAAGHAAWEAVSEAVLVASPGRPELRAVLGGLDLSPLAARQAAAIRRDDGLLPA